MNGAAVLHSPSLKVLTAALCCLMEAAAASAAMTPLNGVAPPVQAVGPASVVAQLIASARFWSQKQRDDLAIGQIQKALRIAPDNPDALGTLGLIEVRMSRLVEAARLVSRLNTLSPDSDAARELDYAYRMAGPDKQEFATVRRLSNTDQTAEAVRRLKALFPKGPPQGDLAADYFDVLAQNPPDRAGAIAALRQVTIRHPENFNAALTLASLLNREAATRMEAASIVARVFKDSEAGRSSVLSVWRRILRAAGDDPAYLQSLQAYAAAAPDDTEFKDLLTATLGKQHEQRALAADPYWQAQREGLSLLDRGRVAQAAPLLEKAMTKRSTDPELLGGLGILRMRQSRQAEARILFERAAKIDPAGREKWEGLAATAQFWSTLRLSSDASKSGNPAQAERYARAAMAMQPDNAYAQRVLLDSLLAQKKWREAEPMLRRLLAQPAADVGVVRDMSTLLRGSGRADEIASMMRGLQTRFTGKKQAAFQQLRADQLSTDADHLLKQDKTGQALEKLEQSLKEDPDSAWTRYTLARTYLSLGLPQLGQSVMNEGFARSKAADMSYATALYRNGQDDVPGAMAAIGRIAPAQRTEGMRALAHNLQAQQLLKKARAQFARGQHVASEKSLNSAAALAVDDPYMLASLGSEWIAQGQPDHGLGLLGHWIHAHSAKPDVDVLLRYGDLLASAKRETTLKRWLADIGKISGLTPKQKQRLEDQGLRQVLRATDLALADEDYEQAEKLLNQAGPAYRADSRWLLELVDLRRDQGRYAEARTVLASILAKKPDDLDAQLALARVLEQSGERRKALTVVRNVVSEAPPDDVDTRLSAARRLVALRRPQEAAVLTDDLHARFAQRPDVTVQQGRILEATGQYDLAKARFQAALAQESQAGVRPGRDGTPAEAALMDLDLRPQPLIETAFIPSYDSGTPGVSLFHGVTVPLHVQVPQGYDGHWFFHADTVKLDAGTLDDTADAYSWKSFGQFAASPQSAHGSFDTRATGVALGAGFEADNWRADVGTTPLGFPVQNLVGGVKVDIPNDYVNLRVNASRRALTSSVLSYSGARDPVSGEVYGGVVRTGVDVRVSRDVGKAGVFAQLGAGVYTGRNVAPNQAYALRTGFTVPVLSGRNWRVESGLVGNYWHYAKNLDFYTYGQGGYYSPQRYLSAGVPLIWTGRSGKASWGLQATVGFSQATTADSDFFPTRPDLQAKALQAGSDNVHTGGSSSGVSYSVQGIFQYNFTRHIVGGLSFSLDRSTTYTPSTVMIYFRYLFNPDTGPVKFPPHGAQLYSDF
ncbi:cellulose synthase subunit BcsC-related outer membrane protein [Paralcaligenes ureilyticus]|uniref:Tetratricopeptide repeat protein n=1 Tax=Paralcaligenes ureilyticus TaxID=627131 RepID=A0A4R3M2P7_9BURK|nr:cellulose synthase subunit BcsC-related outer membrane protein [Paralcaligenes ureilyticus]TCT07474.1 tetratricopeptide repeat protein [Paralcaligenes ureilyticus]